MYPADPISGFKRKPYLKNLAIDHLNVITIGLGDQVPTLFSNCLMVNKSQGNMDKRLWHCGQVRVLDLDNSLSTGEAKEELEEPTTRFGGDQKLHQKLMMAALCCSALFLCSYITYHVLIHGVTRYHRQGMLRAIYFFILGTHTPLAIIILPFSLIAVRHALRKEFQKHTRITRWLLPVWMYVSVTGVLIYLMLYVF